MLKTFMDFEFISIYQYYYMGITIQVRNIAQNHSAFDRLHPLTSQARICKQEVAVKSTVVDADGLIFLKIKLDKTRSSASFS